MMDKRIFYEIAKYLKSQRRIFGGGEDGRESDWFCPRGRKDFGAAQCGTVLSSARKADWQKRDESNGRSMERKCSEGGAGRTRHRELLASEGAHPTKFAEPLRFASRGELSSPARGEVGRLILTR